MNSYTINRRGRDCQLRCGICDQPIATGQPTRYVDDERCHQQCARPIDGELRDEREIEFRCPWCGAEVTVTSDDGCCLSCGESLE